MRCQALAFGGACFNSLDWACLVMGYLRVCTPTPSLAVPSASSPQLSVSLEFDDGKEHWWLRYLQITVALVISSRPCAHGFFSLLYASLGVAAENMIRDFEPWGYDIDEGIYQEGCGLWLPSRVCLGCFTGRACSSAGTE